MYNQLTSEQRYEIYLGIKRKWSISRISRKIEVSASTVLREIRRNCNTSGEYVWRTAQRKAEARKHGLEGNHRKPAELWWRIEQMIVEDWSPSQIAGVLHKEGIHIAIQTIYNHVHADASGRLAKHMPHELTERSTNFILMERLKCGRKAVPTAKVVARLLFPYREFTR